MAFRLPTIPENSRLVIVPIAEEKEEDARIGNLVAPLLEQAGKWHQISSDEELEGLKQRLVESCANRGIRLNVGFVPSAIGTSIQYEHTEFAHQSNRHCMEDAHFFLQEKEGILSGVFDGHRDRQEIAQFCALQFKSHFFDHLRKSPNNFSKVISEIVFNIDFHLSKMTLVGGSTALIMYINQETNVAYVASIGDSEVYVARTTDSTKKMMLPISLIKNWASLEEAQRGRSYLQEKILDMTITQGQRRELQREWKEFDSEMSVYDPAVKQRRVQGYNISRSIGDYDMEAIVSAATTTCFPLLPGDVVLMGSDGFWDFVSYESLSNQPSYAAEDLGKVALDSQERAQEFDNITILSFELSLVNEARGALFSDVPPKPLHEDTHSVAEI